MNEFSYNSRTIRLILFMTLFLNFQANSQVIFQKAYIGANLSETKQTVDSGFVSIGWWNDFSASNHQYTCLIKTNADGDTIWTRMYGGAYDVMGLSIDQCMNGGYIAAGIAYATDSIGAKAYLIRTDLNGDTLWLRKFGGVGDDGARRIRQTDDGGFIVSGVTNSFGAGANDIYIIKIDANGMIEWSRTFGGINNDISYSICQTADGGFMSLGILNMGTINADIILIKMNSMGDTLWTKTYGGPGIDIALCIQETFNNGFIIVGSSESFNPNGSAFALMTDSIGDLIWAKKYECSGYMNGTYISQTADSGFVISGYTNCYGATNFVSFIIRINSVGNSLWSSTYFDYGVAWSVQQTFDGGYVTAGEENEMMKLDFNGSTGCYENSITPSVTNVSLNILNNTIVMSIPSTISFPTQTVIKGGINIINYCTNVGLENVAEKIINISIYPNPSPGKISLTSPEIIIEGMFTIFNSLGERIYSDNISNTSIKEINLIGINPGIYFIVLEVDGNKTFYRKFIIE